MLKVSKENYPRTKFAMDIVFADNMPAQIREHHDSFEANVPEEYGPEMEKKFASLSPEEMENFCVGDETLQHEIRDKYGMQKEHEMLCDFFERMPAPSDEILAPYFAEEVKDLSIQAVLKTMFSGWNIRESSWNKSKEAEELRNGRNRQNLLHQE